jgi:hypothetical protein
MGNLGSMVPVLDILNHNSERDWLAFDMESVPGVLRVVCNYPVSEVMDHAIPDRGEKQPLPFLSSSLFSPLCCCPLCFVCCCVVHSMDLGI